MVENKIITVGRDAHFYKHFFKLIFHAFFLFSSFMSLCVFWTSIKSTTSYNACTDLHCLSTHKWHSTYKMAKTKEKQQLISKSNKRRNSRIKTSQIITLERQIRVLHEKALLIFQRAKDSYLHHFQFISSASLNASNRKRGRTNKKKKILTIATAAFKQHFDAFYRATRRSN